MCKRIHARPSITGGMWLERHKATGSALLPPLKKKRWQRLQPCASCSPASSYVIVTTHDTCKQQQQHHLLVRQKSLRPILHMRRSISFSPNSWLSHRCWTGTRNGTKHPSGIMVVLWVGYSKPRKCPVFLYATLVPQNIWQSQITVQKTAGSLRNLAEVFFNNWNLWYSD
jgi:hypothetical protein